MREKVREILEKYAQKPSWRKTGIGGLEKIPFDCDKATDEIMALIQEAK